MVSSHSRGTVPLLAHAPAAEWSNPTGASLGLWTHGLGLVHEGWLQGSRQPPFPLPAWQRGSREPLAPHTAPRGFTAVAIPSQPVCASNPISRHGAGGCWDLPKVNSQFTSDVPPSLSSGERKSHGERKYFEGLRCFHVTGAPSQSRGSPLPWTGHHLAGQQWTF